MNCFYRFNMVRLIFTKYYTLTRIRPLRRHLTKCDKKLETIPPLISFQMKSENRAKELTDQFFSTFIIILLSHTEQIILLERSPTKRQKLEKIVIHSETKTEICPHAEQCYRRNPHHFNLYDHPHLTKFIEMGEVPDNMPQAKKIYLEQIEILKPMLKNKNPTIEKAVSDSKTNISPSKNRQLSSSSKKTLEGLRSIDLTHSPSPSKVKQLSSNSKNNLDEMSSIDLTHSPSSSSDKRISNKGKTTKYNSRTETNNPPKAKPGTMLEKLEKAAPYNIFFTTIIKSPETAKQPNAVTFTDLLCPSLGTLKCSLQINFMIDIDWLLKQYKARGLAQKPLTIIFGDDWPDMAKFIDMFCPNVSYKLMKMKDPFGIHHSKIGIYVYEDLSLRIVVSTANLYYEDWNHYNQGLWLSPLCPRLPDSSADTDGESPTGFKSTFLNYLKTYNLTHLKPFIECVQRADFSAVKVFFTYSVPGKHYPTNTGSHLHRVADLLSRHCTLPAKTTPDSEGPLAWGIIAQASSIGSMGKAPADWLRGSLLRALASHKQAPMPMNSNAVLSLVYPSVDNVMTGYFGPESGGCLPYSKATNEKQKWLQQYMHQWKAESYGRTRAMPHIKSYCRVSPCLKKLAYFLLTSANLSKSAWGGPFTKEKSVYVRSYEAGVMFLPKFFDEEYFEIKRTVNSKNVNVFPFMYDLPLVPYRASDYPWCN